LCIIHFTNFDLLLMKLTKLLILLLLLSLKGYSQQAVLTSSGEKVILNFLSSLGGTITGTLGITGNTTISGTTTLTGINNTGTITNTGALTNTGKLIVGASSAVSASAVLEASSTTQGFLPPRMSYYRRTQIASPIAGLTIWCSNCGASGEMQVFNGTSWTNMIGGTAEVAISYTIGQSALGGMIFYIDGTGEHGLIAATSNENINPIEWLDAKNACDVKDDGTYSDWRLPTKDELNLMYNARSTIGNFGFDNYWSSTEGELDYGPGVWAQEIGTSGNITILLKDWPAYVRAIRAF
jgi:hypothetical protein